VLQVNLDQLDHPVRVEYEVKMVPLVNQEMLVQSVYLVNLEHEETKELKVYQER